MSPSSPARTVEEMRAPGRMIHVTARRRSRSTVAGALRQAHARWREFDVYRARADYEDAVLACRDAMALEDEAGFVIRPLVRAALQ